MTNPDPTSWTDDGPKSQGKILTHLLRNEPGFARDLLRGWSYGDLLALRNAASSLVRMADREIDHRPGRANAQY